MVDIAFLSANLVKIVSGGWFPLLVGLILVLLMTTWRRGRQLVAERIHRGERPIEVVVHEAVVADAARVPGIAVYMFKDAGAAPPALITNVRHNHVLHQLTLMVSVDTADVPRVPEAERLTTRKVGPGIQQVTGMCNVKVGCDRVIFVKRCQEWRDDAARNLQNNIH